MKRFLGSAISIVALGIAACATASDGTHPDDMSVAGHEAAAVHWLSAANPSAQDQEQYENARALGARHRAAAGALAAAETRACGDIALADRDISPFARSKDIESVSDVLEGPVQEIEGTAIQALRGVSIKFRPVPGLTSERLQRLVDCHLARNASLGYPAELRCPLALKGVQAVVKQASDGLVVEVTSADPAVAIEIKNRSQRLGAPPVHASAQPSHGVF